MDSCARVLRAGSGRAAPSRRRPAARTRSTPGSSQPGRRAGISSRPRSVSATCGATSRRCRRAARRRRRSPASSRSSAVSCGCRPRTGLAPRTPRSCCSSPKRPQRLPRVLKPEEVAVLLDRIPATTPLELRDRALFELAYSSGLRAEELVSLDVGVDRFRRARSCGSRGRARRPGSCRSASTPGARSSATSSVAARRSRSRDQRALFLSKSGRRLSTSDVRRRLRIWSRQAHPALLRLPTHIRTPCVTLSRLICSREAQT